MGGNLHDRFACIRTSFPQAGNNKFLGPFQRIAAHLLMLMVKRKLPRIGASGESPGKTQRDFAGPNLLVLCIP